jgi:hypothetical protein
MAPISLISAANREQEEPKNPCNRGGLGDNRHDPNIVQIDDAGRRMANR